MIAHTYLFCDDLYRMALGARSLVGDPPRTAHAGMTRFWLSMLTALALLVQAAFAGPAVDCQRMLREPPAAASICGRQHKPSKPLVGCICPQCWLCPSHAGPMVQPAGVAIPVASAQTTGLFAEPMASLAVHSVYAAYRPRGPPRRV
jgi:hypothetical protein